MKVIAWVGGAIAFRCRGRHPGGPEARAVSAGPQLVVVPTGSNVVIKQGAAGVRGRRRDDGQRRHGHRSGDTPAVATTGGSAPPPPGV